MTMTFKPGAWALAIALCALPLGALQAQTARAADYIVAVVNSEPITNAELQAEIQRVTANLQQQKQPIPPAAELRKLVLERLVNARAQLQLANETGIRIDSASVDQAEQAIARQSGIDVAELHKRLAKDGIDVASADVAIRLLHSEDTHFLKLKTLFNEKTSTGPKRSHLRTTFQIEIIPLSNALGLKTSIKDLDATRGSLELELEGAPLDENVNIEISAARDRMLGGLVLDHTQSVNAAKLKAASLNGGRRVTIPFNLGHGNDAQKDRSCLKKRPYEFKVKLIRTVSKSITEGLMNPTAVKKIGDSLTSTIEKRVKLTGSKHPYCDSSR